VKKSFLFLMLVLSMSIFAQNITVLHAGDTILGDTTHFKMAEKMLLADYPSAKVTWVKIDLSNGSTLTMDAMLAAGTAPNIYFDTMVRASKYMVPEFALPLDKVIRDTNKYGKGVLAPYTKNGKLMALPTIGGAQGMLINLNIMKEIGYTIPKDWTIKEFLIMAEKVKKFYGGKKWATGMFAANQSGDYLLNAWFASFGVSFYKPGSYDTSIIADTGGAKVYEFYQLLAKNGYIPPNAASLNDDDYALEWQKGNIAATAFFPNWTAGYFKSAIDQKQIEKEFDYIFIPFPKAPGVKLVPTYISNAALVVRNTGTSADAVAARLAEYLNCATIQGELAIGQAVVPNRIDVTKMSTNIHVQEVSAIVSTQGVQDVGLTDPRFTERRALQFPILQQVLNFKLTPDEAIKLYQKKLSTIKL